MKSHQKNAALIMGIWIFIGITLSLLTVPSPSKPQPYSTAIQISGLNNSIPTQAPLDMSTIAGVPLPGATPLLLTDTFTIPPDAQLSEPQYNLTQTTSDNLLVADIAIEGDYEFYRLFGSPSEATSYVNQLVAGLNVIYGRDLHLTFKPTFIRISQTPSDPWTASNTGSALNELRNYWNKHESHRQRAVTLFLSGKNLGGGVAYLGSVCYHQFRPNDSYDYAVAGNLVGSFGTVSGNDTWDLFAVAHELGHVFGSKHSHCYKRTNNPSSWYDQCYGSEPGCYSGPALATNGTIMSYCHIHQGGTANINPLGFTDGDPAMTRVMRQLSESRTVDQGGCLKAAPFRVFLPALFNRKGGL